MGKKRVSELGSQSEADAKTKRAVQLEQKKLREGKSAKAPGLAGGQRVVDTAAESLAELEIIEAKQQATTGETESVKSAKKVRIRSKAYKSAKSQIDSDKTYSLAEALILLKKVSLTKFDPTVELHLTLQDKGFNKDIDLPHSTGKSRRIAIADSETMAKIAAGKIDFDFLLASPDQMAGLVKYAKVLGPKGLMPNPKNGSVVTDPATTAKTMAQKNSLPLKTEKDAPLVHTQVGKLSFGDEKLTANIQAVLTSVPKLQKIVIKTTMSPAIKISLA